MSGFTEEEFEPDPGGAKAGDTTANANGHDTGNNARNNAGATLAPRGAPPPGAAPPGVAPETPPGRRSAPPPITASPAQS